MAAKKTIITLTHGNEAYQTIVDKLLHAATNPLREFNALRNFFHAVAGGDRSAKAVVQVNTGEAVQASGTITFSSLANNDTVTVGGVVFTAKTSGASGAAQFNLGASDTAAAVNFIAKVNAHTTLAQVVTATSALGVSTITAVPYGKIGNYVGIAISAHGSVSAALLAAGVDATTYSASNTYHAGV